MGGLRIPGGRAVVARAALIALLTAPAQAAAQAAAHDPPPPVPIVVAPDAGVLLAAAANAPRPVPPAEDGDRACLACPPRRPLRAIGEVFAVNLLYQGINLVFKSPEERIYYATYPKTWWNNIRHGLEWDDNSFMINQWGHPYQGSTYFSAGRSNGLSFWESAPLAVLGAAAWEYLGERHTPSLNDLVMTSLGGIALGEVFHRSAWLLRDTTDTGKSRLWREIGAGVIDPVSAANRFIDRDALRVVEHPTAFTPASLSASFDAGLLWRGENLSFIDATGEPFLQANVRYGTMAEGRSTTPFDAFFVSLRLGGGGGAISEVRGRGRLIGLSVTGHAARQSGHSLHASALMGYDYDNNSAYQFGGQEFEGALTHEWRVDSRWTLVTTASGGVLVLGAIDSVYDSGAERNYDFGSGLSYGAGVTLMRGHQPFLRADYRSFWLHSLDGADADHWTQNVRVDVILPLKGRVGIGATGEFIRRRTYYDQLPDVLQRFPQVRAYLSWMY